MGHRVSAIVVPGEVDSTRAFEFDARIVPLRQGFTAIALCPYYVDDWAEKLDIPGQVAKWPILNARVIHFIANSLADGRPFALIETDYFDGQGTQSAAAYQSDAELFSPCSSHGKVINKAMKLIGVRRFLLQDEFDTIGLGAHRDWDDLFSEYYDLS